ncbi:EAL domain-containing protein [Actinoallomurus purpureus]|uniref:EAL domain-containing protein n=1 Tax=Actinoallomurus purpureus TaxID=478114 RepID=UPI0020921A7D|nr:EAL domain-containing protein [Actinoallomurus purpureus]MCO6007879.1 EAL domain-containing protein [Actinoallomurus purpureus]
MTAFAAAPGGPESAFAGRSAAPPPAHVTFQPIVDLDAGTVVAVAPSVPGPPILDPDLDVDRAILAARTLSRWETMLPVQLALRMSTLAYARPMERLHQTLVSLGRRPGGVIVSVAGDLAGMPLDEAAARLGGLRSAGYLLALEAGNLPTRFVAEIAPAVLTLDPEVTRRATADPRRSAIAEAFVALGRRLGGHVLAPGVISDDQLTHLRGRGVRLAQGPLLASREWQPGMPVNVPVGSRDLERDRLGPRVTEFMMPATVMPDTATAEEVLSVFNAEPGTSSVVLVDQTERPRHTVDRTRFLLRLAGAYGHALHAHKPAARLADPPRPVPRTVPAIAALRAAGDDAERVYDDLVVIDEIGRCLGVARVGDLIRSLSALDH